MTAGPGPSAQVRQAAEEVLHLYQRLAVDRAHLLDGILAGRLPQAWAHYPDDDAHDRIHGYQWFYHSHSAADRPGAAEHGHLHVFARRPAIRRGLDPAVERNWRGRTGGGKSRAATRHLFCVGLDAKGVPNSLFTVNSWVTGDMMASADGTMRLIDGLRLDTGHGGIDTLVMALARLCRDDLAGLMHMRDEVLTRRAAAGPGGFEDRNLEVLSEVRLDLDARL